MDHSQPLSAASYDRLRAIADALGVPVSALFELSPSEIADVSTLMRLWAAITDVQGRRRVLNLARAEAGRCGYREVEERA